MRTDIIVRANRRVIAKKTSGRGTKRRIPANVADRDIIDPRRYPSGLLPNIHREPDRPSEILLTEHALRTPTRRPARAFRLGFGQSHVLGGVHNRSGPRIRGRKCRLFYQPLRRACKAGQADCQGKVEMSPRWQSRNVPFCLELLGARDILRSPVKRRRAMLASNPIKE